MNKKLLLFLILFLIPIFVNADPVCCEKTLSGATCQYTDQSECAVGSKSAPTNCYFTSFCKLGTCFDLSDGRCYANMPLGTCNARGTNASFSDLSIENTPQCSVGCCIIGDQASLITQTRCKKETAKYPDLEMVFKEDVKDEAACVQLSRNTDKGCCVQSSDNCQYTTRANCALPTGTDLAGNGFFEGKYCSDTKLNCDCTPHTKKGCLDSSEDVYWFDSCGNAEEVAQDCDYVNKQNICGQSKTTKEFTCVDLSCSAEMDLFNMDAKQIFTEGNTIKNGESWCEYDVDMNKYNGNNALIGFGRDVPGSRYYRGVCINNKVLVEPCKDFREEWCISDAMKIDNSNYNVAACRLNRWQDCVAQKNVKDCKNTEQRDCIWNSNGQCAPFISPGSKFWEDEGTDICKSGSQTCTAYIKVPGLTKLLADGGKSDITKSLLGIGLQTFGKIMSFGQTGLAEQPECIENCQCLDHKFTVSANNYCRSLGDCGAEYNLLTEDKENILSGFSITTGSDIPSIVKFAKNVGSGDPGKITYKDLTNWVTMDKTAGSPDLNSYSKLGGALLTSMMTNAMVQGIIVSPLELSNTLKLKVWSSYTISPLTKLINYGLGTISNKITDSKIWQSIMSKVGTSFVTKETVTKLSEDAVAKKATAEAAQAAAEAAVSTPNAKSAQLVAESAKKAAEIAQTAATEATTIQQATSQVATIMKIFSYASYIEMGLQLIDISGTEIVKVNIESKCESWQAPINSKDCEKCNPEDVNSPSWRKDKVCSEYTCKSLGQSCVLLNAGTGNDTCVSQNPRDVKPPVISVWKEGLGNYQSKITEVANRGYTYTETIPAFTFFPMALKTDEPAICKASLNNSARFADIQGYFGSTLYTYDHLVLSSIPNTYSLEQNGTLIAVPGQTYTLYVKCQDSLGNQNDAAYYVRYTIQQGPDVTPPVIEGSNLVDGSYFSYGINQTNLDLYVNEPADCKWSMMDKEYDVMENTMICVKKPNDLTLYPCSTTLTPLIDQIVNKFYFRCKDQPGVTIKNRNTNEQSFVLTLRGSYPLRIDSISPSGEISTRNFTLRVETSKGATYDGKAYCYYGETNDINLMNLFFKTNSSVHEQLLSPARSSTPYTYYVTCVDYGGNINSTSTTIKMTQDVNAPRVTSVYEDSSFTPSHLKIILDEVAECQYNIGKDFTYGDGTAMTNDKLEHDTLFEDGSTYYIKCMDASNNLMSYIFHA
ncbi:MAG: hypothetical protein PHF86_05800 [Candidatus Nanoarchaeia archaeon]|nr:hypothetical protein [Candidatus Nanoarchaeia archaeon]